MKIIFYHDKRSINDATSHYIKIIEKSFSDIGHIMHYTNKLEDVFSGDLIFTITSKYFCMVKFSYPRKKIIYWAQGIAPEEYSLSNKNKIKFYIKKLLECIAVRKSIFLFVVSQKMISHFRSQYRYTKENNLIMPCYNLKYDSQLVKMKGIRYKSPTFVYAGNLAAWQCVEETLIIFKKINGVYPEAKFTILTKDQAEAFRLIEKHSVKNVFVKYIPLGDLNDELSKYKYGFMIRKDIKVNNVSTPTKMNSYLACGVIPIFTDSISAFVDNILLGPYTLCLKANDGIDAQALQIINFEQMDINAADVDEQIKKIFASYYNDEDYVKLIKEKLSMFIFK